MDMISLKPLGCFVKNGLLAGLLLFILGMSQAAAQTQTDIKTLSPEEFLNMVRRYHPVARQADVMVQEATAKVLASRGMFDPSVHFSNYQKTYSGTEYYNYNAAELVIPTWFGIEGYVGLENNLGSRLDAEVTRGQNSYVGLKVPLLKNLVMDERRAMLQQAKIFSDQSLADQTLIINDLLMEAIEQYWNWYLSYRIYNVLSNVVTINEQRYEAIKITVTEGDRAAVDTSDALSQLLNFQLMQRDAYLGYVNAGYQLSTYLWTENEQPYIIPDSTRPSDDVMQKAPQALPMQPLPDLLTNARQFHPKLRIFDYKLDYLEIERKLKFQSILPKLDLKYNALASGYQFWSQFDNLSNNYQFGVDFSMPLLLRKGRGDYEAARLKIRGTQLERSNTALGIENKVKQYHMAMMTQLEQINMAERALEQYRKVLEVELVRFEMGESTIFLVNTRENKVFEAEQKLAELTAKFYKNIYGVHWAAGLLQ